MSTGADDLVSDGTAQHLASRGVTATDAEGERLARLVDKVALTFEAMANDPRPRPTEGREWWAQRAADYRAIARRLRGQP